MDLTCLDPSPEMLATAQPRVDAARAARGEGPAAYVQAIAENIPLPDNTFDMVFCLFSFRIFRTRLRGCGDLPRAQTGRAPGDLRRWEGQQTARFFRYLWMNSVVQVMARLITKEKNHPWKGLAASYTHYGTNGYYRNMMREVVLERSRALALSVWDGQSIPWHEARKLMQERTPLDLNPLPVRKSIGVLHGYVRSPSKHQNGRTRRREAPCRGSGRGYKNPSDARRKASETVQDAADETVAMTQNSGRRTSQGARRG